MDSQHETWQRIALLMGWNTWDLGIKDPDIIALGENIKERKKQEKEMEKVKEKQDKLREKYPDLDDEQIEIKLKSKELFDLNKQEQIDLLKELDVPEKEIKKLKKEQDRTDKIAELYKDNSKLIDNALETSKNKPKKEKKEKPKLSKAEQHKKELFKMNKEEQINKLIEMGLPPREAYHIKYEKDRVDMIIKLESKKRKKK